MTEFDTMPWFSDRLGAQVLYFFAQFVNCASEVDYSVENQVQKKKKNLHISRYVYSAAQILGFEVVLILLLSHKLK